MALKDVFLFKSRQRRQREEAEYQERIFHLGQGHREAVLQRLKSLIREEKTEAELIYLYTCVKDIYTAARPGEREEALGEWYETTYLFPEDKKRLIALVLLESGVSGPDGIPEAEAVEKAAESWG